MNAQPRVPAAMPESVPARRLVELLSRIHPLVLVYDSHGVVRWMSDGFGERCGGKVGQIRVGSELPQLPGAERLAELRTHFEARGFLPNVRIDLDGRDGDRSHLEVSVLRLPET